MEKNLTVAAQHCLKLYRRTHRSLSMPSLYMVSGFPQSRLPPLRKHSLRGTGSRRAKLFNAVQTQVMNQRSYFLNWHLSGCVNGEEQLLFILHMVTTEQTESLSQIEKFGSWVPSFEGRGSHSAKHSRAGKTN